MSLDFSKEIQLNKAIQYLMYSMILCKLSVGFLQKDSDWSSGHIWVRGFQREQV